MCPLFEGSAESTEILMRTVELPNNRHIWTSCYVHYNYYYIESSRRSEKIYFWVIIL